MIQVCSYLRCARELIINTLADEIEAGLHKRPYVGVSQGTVLGFGDGFGAILWETVAKS